MCLDELLHTLAARPVSRRGLVGAGLATGLAAASLDRGRSLLRPGLAQGAQPAPSGGGPGAAGVNFRWFGTAGWEISFGSTTVLLDPWLTRTVTGGLSGRPADSSVSTAPNQALLDQQITKADLILISHGHYDHLPDIPYLAQKTGASVLGSETHVNLLRALGVPAAQLGTVKGGEYIRFDGFTVQVVPSLHSIPAGGRPIAPGHLVSMPAPPTRVADFPEGDSLVYQLTVREEVRIFMMGTANYIESAIAGLEPDIALIAIAQRLQTHAFTPRLLRALNSPRLVLPTHWDNWERPLAEPAQDLRAVIGNDGNVDVFVSEVRQASPASQIVLVDYLESFAP